MSKKRESSTFGNTALCFISGALAAFLLSLSLVSVAFAFESAKFAIEELCGHMTGSLGGLLMSAAAVGGIAAAAFGNFRASFSFIITGIGAFTISSLLSLHFPQAAGSCNGGGTNNTTPNRQIVDTQGVERDAVQVDDGQDIFNNF